MNYFVIALILIFLLLCVFSFVVDYQCEKVRKQRKEEFINALSDEEQKLINAYHNAVKVSIKDVFKKNKSKCK